VLQLPRKLIRSKRSRIRPFDIFEYFYEIDGLMDNPQREPTRSELMDLKAHGLTIQEFRKNHKELIKHRDALLKGAG